MSNDGVWQCIHSSHQLSFSDTTTTILVELRGGYMAINQETSSALPFISKKAPPGISALVCSEYGSIAIPPTHNPYYDLHSESNRILRSTQLFCQREGGTSCRAPRPV